MRLQVHPQKQFLMWEDGTPYYPVADTAWTLPQQLAEEDVIFYADRRQQQGFNTVLLCAFSELDGVRSPNRYGHLPFVDEDPLRPVEAYWQQLDRFLAILWERGFVVGLLPTWGDKFSPLFGKGPAIFTPENAYAYGRWLGQRYRDKDRLFWVLGGDRPLENDTHRQIVLSMGKGLREVSSNLITFHQPGARSSVDFLPDEALLDFHSIQSSHGPECWKSADMLLLTRQKEDKPCWDMECRYEDIEACLDAAYEYCWDAADVRWNVYENMLAGGAGLAYGHRDVWCFHTEEGHHWRDALDAPGARQQAIAASLRCREDYFDLRPMPELLYCNGNGAGKQAAAVCGQRVLVYSPLGEAIHVDLSQVTDQPVRCYWFDPRSGEERLFTVLSPGRHTLLPPVTQAQGDWVLVALLGKPLKDK